MRNLTLENTAGETEIPGSPDTSLLNTSDLPDLAPPSPSPPRGREEERRRSPLGREVAGGFRERSPLRREGGEGFRAGDGYGEMLRTNPRGAREFSPDNRFVEGVLRTVEWMFSGPVMPGERRAVINQLDDELRRIHDNRPWYGEAQVVANLIQHGREQLRDGWLRSNYNGIWFLTERSEEELRDPRVRAREEEEYRRRIANPAAAGREELEMRREAMGEVRYQQERIQRRLS